MNSYQTVLFTQLENLTVTTDAFYSQDCQLDGKHYRIYNYRIASHTQFELPGGRECRGHMFEIDHPSTAIPVRLASLPFPKFHNLGECPLTMNLDLNSVDVVEVKADGSLISTFIHEGEVRFKSKGSLASEQAIDAMNWIKTEPDFQFQLDQLEAAGYTVNMEWCAPHNRIVVGYRTSHLQVLNARNRNTGEYLHRDQLEARFDKFVIQRVDLQNMSVSQFVQSIPDMTDDIEGFVCRIGQLWFKLKTNKYINLHRLKDSINNQRHLFEAVLDQSIDDSRSSFAHDQVLIRRIDDMENRVAAIHNGLAKHVEQFHATHKQLSRKEYAIAGTQCWFVSHSIKTLGLLMDMYLGKQPNYKEFLKKRYGELGFNEPATTTME